MYLQLKLAHVPFLEYRLNKKELIFMVFKSNTTTKIEKKHRDLHVFVLIIIFKCCFFS